MFSCERSAYFVWDVLSDGAEVAAGAVGGSMAKETWSTDYILAADVESLSPSAKQQEVMLHNWP